MHDIYAGEGVAVIDPRGDLAEAIIDALPPERTHEICYLNVADTEYPVGFNPLAGIPRERHALAASGIISALKICGAIPLDRDLSTGFTTELQRCLQARERRSWTCPVYTRTRNFAIASLSASATRSTPVFGRRYPSYDRHFQAEAASPIFNKVGQIAAAPVLRNILGQTSPKFDLAYSMNNRRIFIANLAKGQIGEQTSNLLGSLLMSHLQFVAMARSDQAPQERMPFFVHVDEFQSFGR
jgi:hypothetical protein